MRVFLPLSAGYVCYSLKHDVSREKNADTWRIDAAYMADERMALLRRLTTHGEWELAVRLQGRADFSGGILHGNERCTRFSVIADETPIDVKTLYEPIPFSSLSFYEESDLYDPSTPATRIAHHGRQYVFSEDGLILKQSLVWGVRAPLERCYMAMFPVNKEESEFLWTNLSARGIDLRRDSECCLSGVRFVAIESKSTGMRATLTLLSCPRSTDGCDLLVSDNGGRPYHKIYYRVCHTGESSIGERWDSIVRYCIAQGMNE